jgi:hypothetical protein
MRMNGGMTCQPYIPDYYKPAKCPSVAYPFKSVNSPIIDYDEKAELPQNIRIMDRMFFHGIFNKDETLYLNSDWQKSVRNIFYSLKSFMEKNITNCLRFSDLKNQGISVTVQGNLNIIPVFSEKGTGALMYYSLSAINTNKGDNTKLNKFYVESPIQLLSIYKFLYSDLRKESNDFTHNLSAHQPKEFGYDDLSMNLSIDINNKDDLLTVSQVLNGINIYYYYQMIYNSPPAMSYIHFENLSAVRGLIDDMNDCSYFSNPDLNPWEFKKHLSAGIGTEISREAIGCIYKAYYNLVPGYQAYTDPDEDACSMSFKVGDCGWNAPCDLRGTNLATYPDIPLTIKFTDGEYEDYQNMTINLIDHLPIAIGPTGCRAIILPTLQYHICTLLAIDTDAKYGKDVDFLTLTSVSPNYERIENKITEGSKTYWDVVFKGSPSSGSFTVTDSYGKSDTKSFQIS